MKKFTTYKVWSIVLLLLTGFIPFAGAQQTHNKSVYIVSANMHEENDLLHITMELDLRNLEVDTRNEIVLMPILVGENNKVDLPEILIAGKSRYKAHKRSMALKHNQPDIQKTAYAILKSKKDLRNVLVYEQTIPHEEWMRNSNLIIEGDLCGCGNWKPLEQQQVTGRASYDFLPELAYVLPQVEEKKRKEDTEVLIDFKVNESVIRPDLLNNQMELADLNKAFIEIKSDKNLTVNLIDIIGYASPEGSVTVNENLSKKRAEALKDYLSSQAYFPAEIYHIQYGGENWKGLEGMVEASSLEKKSEVLDIIRNTPDVNARKNKLKTFDNGKTYKYMLTNFYPKLRKTVVDIHYNIRNFTAEEAKEILKTRPGQLNQNELVQIAHTYPKGSKEFSEVFNTAVVLYPDNQVANLNAGAAALSAGDMDTAKKYLDKADKNSAEYLNNMGVYYYQTGNWAMAVEYFSQAAQRGNEAAGQNLSNLNKKMETEKINL